MYGAMYADILLCKDSEQQQQTVNYSMTQSDSTRYVMQYLLTCCWIMTGRVVAVLCDVMYDAMSCDILCDAIYADILL